MLDIRLLGQTLLRVAVYGLLLFLPAWTLNWWRGWTLLACTFAALITTRVWALGDKPELIAARRTSPIQHDQPASDKLLVTLFLIVIPVYIAFIPLDVFHLHLLPPPSAPVAALGLAVAAAGWSLVALAFRENAFAIAIVTDQRKRGQTVIDTGVYHVVRHPLYAGTVLILVGVALWLGSYPAALASVVPVAVIVARIGVEEHFLRDRLDGYDAYAASVRSRLIPRVW